MTEKSELDYKKIKILVSAIIKLVIKDVVMYADRKIKTTKEVMAEEK